MTVVLEPDNRPSFGTALAELMKTKFGVEEPDTVMTYGDGKAPKPPVSAQPSQRTEEAETKVSESDKEKSGETSLKNPEETLGELLNSVPIKYSRELATYFREIAQVVPMLQRMDSLESFWGQCPLVSIDSGYGLSDFLVSLARLYVSLDLVKEMGEKTVRELKVARSEEPQLLWSDWEEAVSAAKDMDHMNRRNGTSRAILCLDIGAWQGELNTTRVKAYLRKLNVHSGTFTLVFRVPFVDAKTLAVTEEALADIFNVRTLVSPPAELGNLVDYARGELAKRAFAFDAGAEDALERWIFEEKRDDSFFGYRTMDKLVGRMICAKALGNCQKGTVDRTMRAIDLTGGLGTINSGEEDPQLELDRLIGLDAVKTKVLEIIAQIKAQRRLSARGRRVKRPAIHMLFSGDPGTGKTTVARIVARLLKKEGVLRKGHLLEVKGRDLCGEYVGQTAPKTSAICRDAYGSVLFIDEAYSLFRGRGNDRDYGREALDTLIAEMENHRDDLCVIMAGYSSDMEVMLGGNEGLRSRIPYTIEFPNYSRKELVRIFFSMMEGSFSYEKGLEREVERFFNAIPDEVLTTRGFANARFVRNLYERTWGKAAYRSRLEDGEIKILASDLVGAAEEREFKQLMVQPITRRPMGFGV